MNANRDHDLLEALNAFVFDDAGGSARFTARLARENRWSFQYAGRVVAEYRRFLYVAVVGGHRVAPSNDVDAAWHLHLIHTRSYWERLCVDVLRQPLHHHPSQSAADSAANRDGYAQTTASYVRLFSEAPPTDIWPKTQGSTSALSSLVFRLRLRLTAMLVKIPG